MNCTLNPTEFTLFLAVKTPLHLSIQIAIPTASIAPQLPTEYSTTIHLRQEMTIWIIYPRLQEEFIASFYFHTYPHRHRHKLTIWTSFFCDVNIWKKYLKLLMIQNCEVLLWLLHSLISRPTSVQAVWMWSGRKIAAHFRFPHVKHLNCIIMKQCFDNRRSIKDFIKTM